MSINFIGNPAQIKDGPDNVSVTLKVKASNCYCQRFVLVEAQGGAVGKETTEERGERGTNARRWEGKGRVRLSNTENEQKTHTFQRPKIVNILLLPIL